MTSKGFIESFKNRTVKKIKRSVKEGKILIIANIFYKVVSRSIQRETWGSCGETPQRTGLQIVLEPMLYFTLVSESREGECVQLLTLTDKRNLGTLSGKLEGVDVTQKVKTIQHNFVVKKATPSTIIMSNFVLEQLKILKISTIDLENFKIINNYLKSLNVFNCARMESRWFLSLIKLRYRTTTIIQKRKIWKIDYIFW